MFELLTSYGFSAWQWGAVILCALLIGISKTGMNGITIVIIPVMAMIFGARESTGVILPMICFADIRKRSWKEPLKNI